MPVSKFAFQVHNLQRYDWEAKLAPFVKLALVKVFKEEKAVASAGALHVESS
jgi:hypothetical protein